MRRSLVLALASLAFLALPALTQERAPALDGFSPDAARSEQQWEEKFRAIPSPDNMRNVHAAAFRASPPCRLAL